MVVAAALNARGSGTTAITVTVYNLGNQSLSGWDLYLSTHGNSPGFFNCNQALGTIQPGGSATFSGTITEGSPQDVMDWYSVGWSGGSGTFSQEWYGNNNTSGGSVTLPASPATVSYSCYIWGGGGGGSGPGSSPYSTCVTNIIGTDGNNITLQNTGNQVQYYSFSFFTGGCTGSNTALGVSPNWYVNGSQIGATPCAASASGLGSWLAVPPGQTYVVGVPSSGYIAVVSNCPGCTYEPPSVNISQLNANQASPCGFGASSGCMVTELCDDGMLITNAPISMTIPLSTTGASNSNVVATNSPLPVQYSGSTSNINWTPSNGIPAQDNHMMQGFSALYDINGQENLDMLAVDGDVKAGTATIAGAIQSNTLANNQNATMLSNVLRSLSNGITVTGSNIDINSSVTNWPTNYPDAANDAYHQWQSNNYQSNLAAAGAFSNLFGSNLLNASNAALGVWGGTGMAGLTSSASNGLANSITVVNNRTYSTTDNWEIVVPWNSPTGGVENITFDLNMFNYPGVADLAALVRQMVAWGSSISFLAWAFGRYSDLLSESTNIAPRGPSGGGLISMFVKGGIALLLIPFVLGLFTLIVAGLLVTGLGWIFPQVNSAINGGPMASGYSGVIESALWLSNQWLPLSLCFSISIAYGAVELGGAFIVTLAKGVLMLIAASCLALLLCPTEAQASESVQPWDFHFYNGSTNFVLLTDNQGGGLASIIVKPGQEIGASQFPWYEGVQLVVASVYDTNGDVFPPTGAAPPLIPDYDSAGNLFPPGSYAHSWLSMLAWQPSLGLGWTCQTIWGFPQQRWPSFSWAWFGTGFGLTMFWGGYRLLYDIVAAARIDRSAPDL